MGKVLKFPVRAYCADCGKPLEDGEGQVCPVDGCAAYGCWFCAQQSAICVEHLKVESDGQV